MILRVSEAIKLIANIKYMKSKTTVKIKLKRPNNYYPFCNVVGKHLAFTVTIARNIPWMEFVNPTLRFGRLYVMQNMAVLQRRMLSFPRDNMTDNANNIFFGALLLHTLKVLKFALAVYYKKSWGT